MKINLTSAIHCGILFHGGSCLTEALVFLDGYERKSMIPRIIMKIIYL